VVEEERGRVESEWREWGSEWRWLEIRAFWREVKRVMEWVLKVRRARAELKGRVRSEKRVSGRS